MEEMELLTTEEAVRFLHVRGITFKAVHKNTLYKWVRKGLIEAHKINKRGQGGQYRFAVVELERFRPPTPGARDGAPGHSNQEIGVSSAQPAATSSQSGTLNPTRNGALGFDEEKRT